MRVVVVAVLVLALCPSLRAAEFVANEKDFHCLLDGTPVPGKHFFIFHRKKSLLRKALKVAERGRPGKHYPVGTILQLLPFEAMAKRGRRFNPAGDGWEFFRLAAERDGTTRIVARGKEDVANRLGSCQGCHARVAPTYDLVCEFAQGVEGLGLTEEQLQVLQRDPRCPH